MGRDKEQTKGKKPADRSAGSIRDVSLRTRPYLRKKKLPPPPSNLKASLAALAAAPPNLLFALASHADEAAAVDAGGGFKVTPLEILIVMAPVAFYALLSAYRSLVNPKASIGDGLFIVAALVIVANVVSILAFHKRIY